MCVVSKSSLLLGKDFKNAQVRATKDRALCLLGPWQPLETISSFFSREWSHSVLKYFVLHLASVEKHRAA